jgi:hypothetical protein
LVFFSHPCPGLPGVLLLSDCPTKLCLHLCSLPIRATCPTLPITLYSVSSTDHEAAFCAVFSSLLLLFLSNQSGTPSVDVLPVLSQILNQKQACESCVFT